MSRILGMHVQHHNSSVGKRKARAQPDAIARPTPAFTVDLTGFDEETVAPPPPNIAPWGGLSDSAFLDEMVARHNNALRRKQFPATAAAARFALASCLVGSLR